MHPERLLQRKMKGQSSGQLRALHPGRCQAATVIWRGKGLFFEALGAARSADHRAFRRRIAMNCLTQEVPAC